MSAVACFERARVLPANVNLPEMGSVSHEPGKPTDGAGAAATRTQVTGPRKTHETVYIPLDKLMPPHIIQADMAEEQGYLEKRLREAIRRSGLTGYRLAKDSGVPQPVLSRFINGRRGITLTTASKLAVALGLELKPRRKPRRRAGRKKA